MNEFTTKKEKDSTYKYIGQLSLMEKVKYLTRWSVAIFIIAAVVIVASIVLFFIMENLLWPTLVLVAGVIIALVAGLVRSVTAGKIERRYKLESTVTLGSELYEKYASSFEEKYKALTGSPKHDQELYKYFEPIEFIILINSHMSEVTTLTHEFKKNGYSYILSLDNNQTHTITFNPIKEIEESISTYLDSYVDKEIVNKEIEETKAAASN